VAPINAQHYWKTFAAAVICSGIIYSLFIGIKCWTKSVKVHVTVTGHHTVKYF